MSALTKVQVISNAIALLGKKPILSLAGEGDLVVAAEQAFDFLYAAAFCENQWRFACGILQLSEIASPPFPNSPVTVDYNYAYQLPADFLKTIRIFPQSYDWELFYNKIMLTNQAPPIYMEYVFEPIIERVPPYFWKYFVYEIAAYLALSSAQETDYYQALEQKRGIRFAIACASDAQNRPQTPIQSAPMITNRYVTQWAYG
ncbi:MAG: hypothetical protein V4440_07820 [Pseudomonadota bacterium]